MKKEHEREAERKRKIAQARDAYKDPKSWDYNRLDTKEKQDKSRLMDRKGKK